MAFTFRNRVVERVEVPTPPPPTMFDQVPDNGFHLIDNGWQPLAQAISLDGSACPLYSEVHTYTPRPYHHSSAGLN
jgi:hypothetical protein